MFKTYIVYSSTLDRYYTGHTNDLRRRLEEHNRGKTQYMAKGVPWMLVYSKEFATRSDAMKLESSIKKRGAKRFLADLNS